MAKRKKCQSANYQNKAGEFWQRLQQEVGSQAVFVDSCAILGCLVPADSSYRDYMDNELSGYRLYTSTHVVSETVRRLAKRSSPYPFEGPKKEVEADLAAHVVKKWVSDRKIRVVSITDEIFTDAKDQYVRNRRVKGWDLTDAISLEIIQGMNQNRILSADIGFRILGLMLMPSDAWEQYQKEHWMS